MTAYHHHHGEKAVLLSSFHKGATPHTALPTRPHGTGAVLYASSPWCKNWCYPRLQLRKWRFREVKGTQGLESSSFHRVILPPGLVKGTDMYRSAPIPSTAGSASALPTRLLRSPSAPFRPRSPPRSTEPFPSQSLLSSSSSELLPTLKLFQP